jgi:glycosyltransferase involved in cell wall biosynthesis
MTAAGVFWVAAGILAYAWIGYPLLLHAFAALARRRPAGRAARPSLSVIVAAYNEAACIRAKIDGTLAQRYPSRRLEVIVVSDGSTDVTDAIVASHPDLRVRLIRQEPRAGKSPALNRGALAARGEVLVFTDANALFAPEALARLAAPFADPRVGLVSGQGLYTSADGDARAVSGGYVRYEAALKRGESALGFLASADGAIYAMRRSLYRDLAAAEVNDFLHPIHAALAGFESRFEPEAYTLEPASHDGGQEFRRHARIVAQGMHLLRRWLPALIAAGRWRAVWMLLSHRAVRWLNTPALAALLGTSVWLLPQGALYQGALAGQVMFYGVALTGWLGERTGRSLGRLAIPYYFCLVSAAGVAGFARFVRGQAQAVWAPTGAVAGRAA